MRRADRLFLLIQALRGRRVVTARDLADKLEVSERTVYRDVRDLQLSGVPIEGEAGIGYALRRGSDVPPLMFTREELEALVIGARMVQAWTGQGIARSARQALLKIEGVLPESLRDQSDRSRVFAPRTLAHLPVATRLDALHQAIDARQVIELDYRRADGVASQRAVRPLCLAFWGKNWTLGGWCELRRDFRDFRLDRIDAFRALERRFEETGPISLQAYLEAVGSERVSSA